MSFEESRELAEKFAKENWDGTSTGAICYTNAVCVSKAHLQAIDKIGGLEREVIALKSKINYLEGKVEGLRNGF